MCPPLCSTIPYTVESPSPVPFPGSLVVKNGSKMRAWLAGPCPRRCRSPPARRRSRRAPRSAARARRRRSARGWPWRSRVRPPWGIASRAFTTRLISTCSIWPGSASTYQSAGSSSVPRARCRRRRDGAACRRARSPRVQREHPRLEHLPPAEGQQLPGEARGALAGVPDLLDVARGSGRPGAPPPG